MSRCRICACIAIVFHLRIIFGGVSTANGDSNKQKKHCSWWCANFGETFEWRGTKLVTVGATLQKVLKVHAAPAGFLNNAPGLLANQ